MPNYIGLPELQVSKELETKVSLTGNQTIAGVKTFNDFPVTPSSAPTTDYQVVNKKYIDDIIGATSLDIDTLYYPGLYRVDNTSTGVPIAEYGSVMVSGDASGSTGITTQVYVSSGTARIFTRGRQSSTWTSWREITGLGINQTYQNVTAQRALSTNFTNNETSPIYVKISAKSTVLANLFITVDGLSFPTIMADAGYNSTVSAIVPPGSIYSASIDGGTPTFYVWAEMKG